ncbi:MAG TPA: coenzyme F420-0:L-glutamate ligase [Candidatus Sulfotelmatobacter sp.]|jgi:putative folate metabolism gamma-glutamate ligase|nr:coenzyme F420-0:L-glutamate ligase [Candidatus Sulfotelmatobacter sp.]
MNITAYKTHKIQPNENLYEIMDRYFPSIQDKSVIVLASKIVGICEGNVVKINPDKPIDDQKTTLIEQEADYYIPKEYSQYGFILTMKHNLMVGSAGIDESNSNGFFSLWPKDPQKSANAIREYLVKKHGVANIGVILTDSKLTPLRWGVTGYAITHSGFQALHSYIGKPDIYGHLLHAEQANIADSFAAAAVVTMGEGNEQQPLAIINDIPFVTFQKRNPTEEELNALKIDLKDDIYASLLTSVSWKKGKK